MKFTNTSSFFYDRSFFSHPESHNPENSIIKMPQRFSPFPQLIPWDVSRQFYSVLTVVL